MTGRSTVIRFPSAPRKVVLGNQNYFNVEFIDSDITIQPQGVFSSNLFVYGDSYTYGFILKVNPIGDYDDLVFIRTKAPPLPRYEEPQKPKPIVRPDLRYGILPAKGIQLQIEGIVFKWSDKIESYYGDIFITSKLKDKISINSLDIQLLAGSKNINSISPVSEDEFMPPNKKVRIRAFSKFERKDNVRLRLKLQNKEVELPLKWKK